MYPGASSPDIENRKASEEIIIHLEVNKLTNHVNYLSNLTKIVRLVHEKWKNTKLCFSSIICRANVKDIDAKINESNSHLENYCKQQNNINNLTLLRKSYILNSEEVVI